MITFIRGSTWTRIERSNKTKDAFLLITNPFSRPATDKPLKDVLTLISQHLLNLYSLIKRLAGFCSSSFIQRANEFPVMIVCWLFCMQLRNLPGHLISAAAVWVKRHSLPGCSQRTVGNDVFNPSLARWSLGSGRADFNALPYFQPCQLKQKNRVKHTLSGVKWNGEFGICAWNMKSVHSNSIVVCEMTQSINLHQK